MRRISDKTPLSRIVLTATRRHCQRTSSGLSSNLGAHSPCR
jgi:hypothetical protein